MKYPDTYHLNAIIFVYLNIRNVALPVWLVMFNWSAGQSQVLEFCIQFFEMCFSTSAMFFRPQDFCYSL